MFCPLINKYQLISVIKKSFYFSPIVLMSQATTLCVAHWAHRTNTSLAHEMIDLPLDYQIIHCAFFFFGGGLLFLVTLANLPPLEFFRSRNFSLISHLPPNYQETHDRFLEGLFSLCSLQVSSQVVRPRLPILPHHSLWLTFMLVRDEDV